MNDEPITRRDVVALFAYVFLLSGALSRVLMWLSLLNSLHLSVFASTVENDDNFFLPTLGTVVLNILLVPLVPFVANGAAGRNGSKPAYKRDLRFLLLPCLGLSVLGLGLSELVNAVFYWWMVHTSTSPGFRPKWEPISLSHIAAASIQMSLGFALAFFPAIFDTLRHRMPNEENAA